MIFRVIVYFLFFGGLKNLGQDPPPPFYTTYVLAV
jgi:hypothetical protein